MRVITIGIGGLEVSRDPDALLVTHALGSCIAVLAHDLARGVGGLLHFQLPSSGLAPERAQESPGTFADTGIPLLLARMWAHGARRAEVVVKAAGGGSFHPGSRLDVGLRNQRVMRELLAAAGLPLAAEDVGGHRSRTVRLEIATGRVTVRSGDVVAAL